MGSQCPAIGLLCINFNKLKKCSLFFVSFNLLCAHEMKLRSVNWPHIGHKSVGVNIQTSERPGWHVTRPFTEVLRWKQDFLSPTSLWLMFPYEIYIRCSSQLLFALNQLPSVIPNTLFVFQSEISKPVWLEWHVHVYGVCVCGWLTSVSCS